MRDTAQLLLLDRDAIAALLTADLALHAVRDAFTLHSRREGRVFPVVREQLADGVFGIKSGDVAARRLLGFKAAGFWPANRLHGGEPHQATVMLFDPATGRPMCLMDGNAITTARTAAAAELGTLLLARADSTRLTVFGTGVQARAQVAAAMRALPALASVRYVSRDGKPDARFEAALADQRNMRGVGDASNVSNMGSVSDMCSIRHAPDADIAVADSDVVITATPGGGALFNIDAVRPGTHFTCVGADTRGKRELPEGLLERSRVVADDRAQALALGEMQWAADIECVELGDVLTGGAFTRAENDVTVFDMTGLALQDLVLGECLFAAALEAGVGNGVAWPW
ncbi:UNVERIFIED_ORG: ornithine cyclodeaminase [Zoogloea ramigera]|uniref:Ornithine cyclodeaminase family protein n=1 Tax=Duganella zoogloeoides TaxID=75659 RepID=A0ABZ0XU81_9BURK|nr:ornithine cyclodeaminase family protein [Duganella zoogloeoides]WQH02782.1 ornithine cyclodeaminase family protein [Duganella zoogloeoides]